MPYHTGHRLSAGQSYTARAVYPEKSRQYNMYERESALKEWLKQSISPHNYLLSPLSGDASFRRYFRIQYNGLTQVVMDAPPGKEDLKPFIHVAKVLAEAQMLVPEIKAIDLQQGFLLLSDLGDRLLLSELCADTVNHYYNEAINTLIRMQHCSITDPELPAFDKNFMIKEMSLCPEWFLKAYLAIELKQEEEELLQKTMNWIAATVAQQPLVFIHRDYHSRNLMLRGTLPKIDLGVIDFQDAMVGPLTYDLVSLLKDCYISWPREQVINWALSFYKRHSLAQQYSESEFIRAFDLCGLQRHLKVLGIFCRLHLRDGKDGYLKDLPRTLNYVLECSEIYEELHPLFHFLQNRVYLP